MTERFYPEWLARPWWQRVWCWLAYHLWLTLPLATGDGLYSRLTLWLLGWAGCYAHREMNHPTIGVGV